MTFFVTSFLAVYFDYTLGALENISLPWNFFMNPLFWSRKPHDTRKIIDSAACRTDVTNDLDVSNEEEKTRELVESQTVGRKLVEIHGIGMVCFFLQRNCWIAWTTLCDMRHGEMAKRAALLSCSPFFAPSSLFCWNVFITRSWIELNIDQSKKKWAHVF